MVENAERRGLEPGHPKYRARRSLREATKVWDRRLTSVQRVLSRFGGAKRPTELTIEIEKAKSLREISKTLVGILDVMRYQVC